MLKINCILFFASSLIISYEFVLFIFIPSSTSSQIQPLFLPTKLCVLSLFFPSSPLCTALLNSPQWRKHKEKAKVCILDKGKNKQLVVYVKISVYVSICLLWLVVGSESSFCNFHFIQHYQFSIFFKFLLYNLIFICIVNRINIK